MADNNNITADKDQAQQEKDKDDGLTTEIKNNINKMRMYEKVFPEVDELVMCRVDKETGIGVIVNLLEYGNIEGVVLLSDIVKRRMRSVKQHLAPGQQVVLQVLRVDEKKGYIDLSKKLVQPEDDQQCQNWYNKSKTVHSIFGHIAIAQTDLPKEEQLSFEDLYKKIGWPLYKSHEHALDAFELLANGTETPLEGLEISEPIKKLLLTVIKHRLGSKPVKLQADIQVTCFTPAGIDGIKPALTAAEKVGSDNDTQLKVHLVRSPEYILFLSCKDTDKGIALLEKAIVACTEEIQKHGGDCVVKTAPRVVST